MKIGYARVSTRDQNLDLQVDALQRAGCERIYQDVAGGAKTVRPELDKMLGQLRAGDVLVMWKLDRMGRSLAHLVELTGNLVKRKVGLVSLNDPVDTTSAQGRLVFNLFASIAEFEIELIRERTQAAFLRQGAGPRRRTSERSVVRGPSDSNGGGDALPRETPERLRHRREAPYIEKHPLQLPASPWRRHRRLHQTGSARSDKAPEPSAKTATVLLSLRIENNNSFVRGKKRVKDGLEPYLRHQYAAILQPSGKYRLKVPYPSDEELDRTMEDLLQHIGFEADLRNCFSESSASLENSNKHW